MSDWYDNITGGRADHYHPTQFVLIDLIDGIQVEMEHTNNIRIAAEIAMDHLVEDPDYYRKLATIHKD
jgi:hypothetical protein